MDGLGRRRRTAAMWCGAVRSACLPCLALLAYFTCAELCCAVLCCAVLCCAVLCCAVLCCAVLCCAVLCCAMHGLASHRAHRIASHRAVCMMAQAWAVLQRWWCLFVPEREESANLVYICIFWLAK
ncbi:hypothetical protein LY76DRAFT_114784 [Colletotrichum caudatum]|nr:hypothetical protein LY76DRAFT_114784 [Colletotrichum caudatum]